LDEGKLNIVIGTHALFNKNILFEQLGLVIIDEQHRFGVKQRLAMIEKHKEQLLWKNNRRRAKNDLREDTGKDFEDEIKLLPIPHLLSMSATPIPRTLALTIYGDLDLSILDELPPGRKRAETKVITATNRKEMYVVLREKLEAGKQAYIIAPRIYNDTEEVKNQNNFTDHKKAASGVPSRNQAESSGQKNYFGDSPDNKKSSVEFEEKRIKEWLEKEKLNYKIGILHGRQPRPQWWR
jgi:ATP-dependent DNA helicase RecG